MVVLLAADTGDEAGDVDFVAAVAGVDGGEGERRMRSRLRAPVSGSAGKPVSSGWRREEWRFNTGSRRGGGQALLVRVHGNTLPMANHLGLQFPESSQSTQKAEVANVLGHKLYALAQIPIEIFQPSRAFTAARLPEQVVEDPPGIRQVFKPLHGRHG